MSTKNHYSEYLYKTNISGSGKATSYIRALDLLSEMLTVQPFEFQDCIDIWNITSLARISELKDLVNSEQREGSTSIWLSTGIAPSYLTKGYCKAALSSYEKFLVETHQENTLMDAFNNFEGNGSELSNHLDTEPQHIDVLIDGLKKTEGEDVVRRVKARLNQNVFRRMLMNIYNDSCCVTGLNIPQVNRASHIIPWANDPAKRLDPSNGLYLSATYDAAFDSKLISLDDEYRLILANNIKDHYTHESVNEHFVKKEGQTINLPYKYLPNKSYLAQHRKSGDF